ncbi:MAG: hypothetical protein WBA74_10335 [Cyclobacteriaceae bacterium]
MNRARYVGLYLLWSGMNGRQLAKELGYSKNMVYQWINQERPVKDFTMNHLILYRKNKKCLLGMSNYINSGRNKKFFELKKSWGYKSNRQVLQRIIKEIKI